jgi:hypothetical protein
VWPRWETWENGQEKAFQASGFEFQVEANEVLGKVRINKDFTE